MDQKLPKRTKIGLRGTLGRDLLEEPSEWDAWCESAGIMDKSDACGVDDSDSDDVAVAEKPYGLVWATFEWRF